MCTDPTIFGYALDAIALLVGVIFIMAGELCTSRRLRPLRRYRADVDQLQQALRRERDVAAADCRRDMYRLIKTR